MKKIFTLLFCVFSFMLVNAQKNSELSMEYLKTQQNKSIENEDYELAAKYKKAITLKTQLKEAVEEENWDKAAELKGKLNDIDFLSTSSAPSKNDDYYSNNSGLRDFSDREFMEGGFFLDGMIGAGFLAANGFTSDPNLAFDFQMGTKWHFGEGRVYRPGFQMTWFRLGLQKSPTSIYFSTHLYPINVGYASIFGFSDELGLEVNVNAGPGFNFILSQFPDADVQVGLHVNPNVKFRYGSFAVGVDISMLNGPIVTNGGSLWFSSNIYSLTLGGKF